VNIPERPAESPERKAILELKQALLSMRTMFHLSALCGLMLTAAIFVIIMQQVALLRRQSDDMILRINEYNNTFVPQIENVRTNLEAFARTNQSLTPLLRRYFPTNEAAKPIPTPQGVSTNR
jgi:hypothetical protein